MSFKSQSLPKKIKLWIEIMAWVIVPVVELCFVVFFFFGSNQRKKIKFKKKNLVLWARAVIEYEGHLYLYIHNVYFDIS